MCFCQSTDCTLHCMQLHWRQCEASRFSGCMHIHHIGSHICTCGCHTRTSAKKVYIHTCVCGEPSVFVCACMHASVLYVPPHLIARIMISADGPGPYASFLASNWQRNNLPGRLVFCYLIFQRRGVAGQHLGFRCPLNHLQ